MPPPYRMTHITWSVFFNYTAAIELFDLKYIQNTYVESGNHNTRNQYNDVIISPLASQITSHTTVYSTVYARRRSKKTSKLRVTGLLLCISRHVIISIWFWSLWIGLCHMEWYNGVWNFGEALVTYRLSSGNHTLVRAKFPVTDHWNQRWV